MPYIKKNDRREYFSIIEGVLNAIPQHTEPFAQVEYVGFFVNGVMKGFDHPKAYNPDSNLFDALCEDIEIKRIFNEHIFASLQILSEQNLEARAGELNYLISAVIWGYLGDSALFAPARYATRAYMRGVLLRIKDELQRFGPLGEYQWRSYLLLRGVFGDILSELYRRRTAVYEDQKIAESGDIWPLRVENIDIE